MNWFYFLFSHRIALGDVTVLFINFEFMEEGLSESNFTSPVIIKWM